MAHKKMAIIIANMQISKIFLVFDGSFSSMFKFTFYVFIIESENKIGKRFNKHIRQAKANNKNQQKPKT